MKNWFRYAGLVIVIAVLSFMGGRFSNRVSESAVTSPKGKSDPEVISSSSHNLSNQVESVTLGSPELESVPNLDAVEETYNWRNVARLLESIRAVYQKGPEDARRLVLDLKPQGIFLEGFKELGRLEARDPEVAIEIAETIENEEALDSYYLGLLSGLARIDPGYAMEVYLGNREAFTKVGSLDSIVSEATLAGNPRMALLAIRQHIPHDEHPRYFYQTYSQWGSINRREALKDLERRNPSKALGVGAAGLFDRWARMDRENLEAWLEDNEESRFFQQANRTYQKIYGK